MIGNQHMVLEKCYIQAKNIFPFILDTLKHLAESPLNVEGDPDQPLEGDTNPYIQQINSKYKFFDWAKEELSLSKVEKGEIAMLRSELAIDYIIRTRFTDE